MLSTMELGEVVDFLMFLVDEIKEEQLYDLWIRSQSDKSYPEWKKQVLEKSNEAKKRKASGEKSSEEDALKYASQFIKSPTEGGR